MFRAAIFDMDGLLIDSEPFWQRAERAVFATVGIDVTEEMSRVTAPMCFVMSMSIVVSPFRIRHGLYKRCLCTRQGATQRFFSR